MSQEVPQGVQETRMVVYVKYTAKKGRADVEKLEGFRIRLEAAATDAEFLQLRSEINRMLRKREMAIDQQPTSRCRVQIVLRLYESWCYRRLNKIRLAWRSACFACLYLQQMKDIGFVFQTRIWIGLRDRCWKWYLSVKALWDVIEPQVMDLVWEAASSEAWTDSDTEEDVELGSDDGWAESYDAHKTIASLEGDQGGQDAEEAMIGPSQPPHSPRSVPSPPSARSSMTAASKSEPTASTVLTSAGST